MAGSQIRGERSLRWVLALALVATIPLALWGGGCGKGTVVEPQGDGGPSDKDSGYDGSSGQCCDPTQANQTQCTADGTAVLDCLWYYAAGPACADDPAISNYGYGWLVTGCPNGCAVSTIDGGTAARCQ